MDITLLVTRSFHLHLIVTWIPPCSRYTSIVRLSTSQTWLKVLEAQEDEVDEGLTSAFPKVYNVSKILWWSRYSMHGPVSPDSRSFSSWTKISNICSRWDGMFVSVTGALSSRQQKTFIKKHSNILKLHICTWKVLHISLFVFKQKSQNYKPKWDLCIT